MSKKNASSNSGEPSEVKSSTATGRGSANPADTSDSSPTAANAIGEASTDDAIGHASIGCDNGGVNG